MPHALLVGVRGDRDTTIAELRLYGLDVGFLDQFDLDELNAQLQAVTDEALDLMKPTVVPPLVSWGSRIRGDVGKIVAYELKSLKGLAPASAAVGDENLILRAQQAREDLRSIGTSGNKPEGLVDSDGSGGEDSALPTAPVSDVTRGW